MPPKITPEEWFSELKRAINSVEIGEIVYKRESEQINVKFHDEINTVQLLDTVDADIEDRTRLSYNPPSEIKFKFNQTSVKRDKLKHTELIERILSEDIPVHKGFEVEYDIYPNFISVKSPKKKPLELFQSLLTRYWVFSGMYKKNGIYIQQFRQANRISPKTRKTDEEEFKNFGSNRIQEILQNLSFNCPHCDHGNIEYVFQDEEYLWNCSECNCSSTVNEKLPQKLNPLDTRKELLNTIREQSVRSIGNHNLQRFEKSN